MPCGADFIFPLSIGRISCLKQALLLSIFLCLHAGLRHFVVAFCAVKKDMQNNVLFLIAQIRLCIQFPKTRAHTQMRMRGLHKQPAKSSEPILIGSKITWTLNLHVCTKISSELGKRWTTRKHLVPQTSPEDQQTSLKTQGNYVWHSHLWK